ncbi:MULTISPECIES: hypothetical protein [Bacillaceae]|uniref:hypothetical protein n=1 Tax=Bacillaceae TaxID=186817 RepID=UPI000C762583|nr:MULTISPECIES: hypothetical protein [Bacillaceae]PLR67879.1 hypothetical protein CYJ36_11205 [Bacillus sp. UMB0893]QNG60156.1 hypothetical protein H4O14_01100 [Bacillus sp. PAMC26568]
MRQKALISGIAISTVGVGVTSYFLKDKANRQKVTGFVQSAKNKIPYFARKNTDAFPVEKAGHPDPRDIDDNKMVSEGSMYPVQYYDEKKK